MKIAFVCSFPKLSQTFILTQITGLLDLGHDVRIFATHFYEDGIRHRDVQKYGLLKRVHRIAELPPFRILRILGSACIVARILPTHPIMILKALRVFRRDMGHVSSLRFLRWVVPFIKGDFDIIQCHFGPNGIRCIPLKKIGVRAKLVTAFHGFDVTTFIRQNGDEVYSDLFKIADLFTYNSEATKQKLLELGCPPDRMAKLPMGIHLDQIDFAERKMQSDNRINVLSVGRLVEMKGREYAIRAMARIIREFPNVTYNIAGDGPLRRSLQELIDNLGMGHAVKLFGWVDSEQLDELYRSSHIFLHPSVTASNGNMEGQGVVLAEAQGHGMPVVATNHNAFPDSIVDGLSGFLVSERDVDALVEKLRYLVEHADVWPQMGRCGREFVEKKFDSKILNKRLERIYQETL